MATAAPAKGLEGIVAANSGICWIDGEAGVLAYRGIDIHELAERSTFEETAYLLWFGTLPTSAELADFSQKLAVARTLPPQIVELLKSFPNSTICGGRVRATASFCEKSASSAEVGRVPNQSR